jgi:putative spermidine/putrescine transport system substrate-binding protein
MRRTWLGLVIIAAVALVAAACGGNGGTSGGSGGGGGSSGPKPVGTIGTTEGELDLIAWAGYVESGENDPNFDWVTPFQNDTGCTVKVKYADTSAQMITLMRQGGGAVYDGVSASGNASNALIAHGDVAPIDVEKLIPNYDSTVMKSLQAPKHNTVNGVHYGVPYEWGPNFLMYNTDVVTTAPTSWNVVFEPEIDGQANPFAADRVVTAYNDSIYIADAALYLKAHDTSLGITDPYELTSDQLDAAVALLEKQHQMVSKYWALYTDEIDGFNSGAMALGTAWPVNYALVKSDGKVPVATVYPSEGVTGWADTWMMSSHAPHPNCMLKWMQYTMQPEVQTQVAEYYGATPSLTAACPLLQKDIGADATELYHCGDDAFLAKIYLWKTPVADCGNGKSDCMDVNAWDDKWTQIIGG